MISARVLSYHVRLLQAIVVSVSYTLLACPHHGIKFHPCTLKTQAIITRLVSMENLGSLTLYRQRQVQQQNKVSVRLVVPIIYCCIDNLTLSTTTRSIYLMVLTLSLKCQFVLPKTSYSVEPTKRTEASKKESTIPISLYISRNIDIFSRNPYISSFPLIRTKAERTKERGMLSSAKARVINQLD